MNYEQISTLIRLEFNVPCVHLCTHDDGSDSYMFNAPFGVYDDGLRRAAKNEGLKAIVGGQR